MYGDAPLADDVILESVDRAWGIELTTLDYSAVGYGSFHWLAADDRGRRWFVTLDGSDWPVADAYALAVSLGARLDFVRAPIATVDEGAVWDVDGWSLTLWPWVEGHAKEGFVHPDEDLPAVVARLRRLHAVDDLVPVDALVEDWQMAVIGQVEVFTEEAAGWEASGPYAAEVAARVLANAGMLRERVDRYRTLVERVAAECPFVVTHGEPHPGNLIHTEDGPVLIDWDTVRWAPKERDLWMLGDPKKWQAEYGSAVSADACEVYSLQWFLTEMADFIPLLVSASERTVDRDVAFEEVQRALPL